MCIRDSLLSSYVPAKAADCVPPAPNCFVFQQDQGRTLLINLPAGTNVATLKIVNASDLIWDDFTFEFQLPGGETETVEVHAQAIPVKFSSETLTNTPPAAGDNTDTFAGGFGVPSNDSFTVRLLWNTFDSNTGNLDDLSVFIYGTPSFLVPEASTWAMMLVGFAGLGFATYRKTAKPPSARTAI